MSFNLTLVSHNIAVCVTDRRLTIGKKIFSERSTKLTTFQCQDAHGFITYNGIGTDMQGATPSDWLCDLHELPAMPLGKMLEAIKADTDRRLADEAKKRSDTRHSFVIGGYQMHRPFVALISNYENINDTEAAAAAHPEMTVDLRYESWPRTSNLPYMLLSTGAPLRKRAKAGNVIIGKLKSGGSPEAIRAKMIKIVRDVAYATGRKGTVGTSVLSAITGPMSGFDINGHVPGGSTLLEGANHIAPGMSMKDMYIDVSGKGEFRSRYDPKTKTTRIDEPPCKDCGAPVPEGYPKCGVCDAPVQ